MLLLGTVANSIYAGSVSKLREWTSKNGAWASPYLRHQQTLFMVNRWGGESQGVRDLRVCMTSACVWPRGVGVSECGWPQGTGDLRVFVTSECRWPQRWVRTWWGWPHGVGYLKVWVSSRCVLCRIFGMTDRDNVKYLSQNVSLPELATCKGK